MTIMERVKEDHDTSEVDEENVSNVSDQVNVSDEEDNGLSNTGWADAISKILKQKPKKKRKSVVLSKAKKITDLKKVEKESFGFEIDGAEDIDKIKEETSEEVKTESTEPTKKKRKELPNLRVKPNILEKDRERTLQKIATKGVVQLFNAVKKQQQDISKKLEEAGPLEVRKEKVLKNIDKRAFLDVLMGEKSQKLEDDTIPKINKNVNTDKDVTWSVLKEDFMMGAKMKDWDKQLETEDVQVEED
ncbi:RRP15-like protein [Diorhabda carinulata]|uniref:RRP15-like protein n=1 Tax=Diorhabda carinulata TaxID=1163345 RepID=UPI0025A2C1F2|nr:RRP15-like protein [Diorhabda carinulata]